MVVVDIKEVRAPEGTAFPLTINFAMRGVTASTKVQILHYKADASEWEKIPTTVADGSATGVFNSLSPVAFVVDKTTLSTATTSPATSATSVSTVAVLGLAAAAAALALKKKSC